MAPLSSEVKWLMHYSSVQNILTVGDGDFSFSLALATAFGSGENLVATSLDSYVSLLVKHNRAGSNVTDLKRLGATVLHGVNANTMSSHSYLNTRRFDRIVFNFPHAGFKGLEWEKRFLESEPRMIKSHKKLVSGFLRNARLLLCPGGEIHITTKTGHPYDSWDIDGCAVQSSLVLLEKSFFWKEDYPGYMNKRGDGPKCNRSFRLYSLNNPFTFKFRLLEA